MGVVGPNGFPGNIGPSSVVGSPGSAGATKAVEQLTYNNSVIPLGTPKREFGLGNLKYTVIAADTINSKEVLELLNGPKKGSVFTIVDTQNDFIRKTGSLPVNGGDERMKSIIEYLDNLKEGDIDRIDLTVDNHTPESSTFAKSNQESFHDLPDNFEGIEYVHKRWPPHCVQGTKGAHIDPGVAAALENMQKRLGDNAPQIIVATKGEGPVEAYSALDNVLGYKQPYKDFLEKTCVDGCKFHVVGVATDYCAGGLAKDLAKMKGFTPTLWLAGCAAVYADNLGASTSKEGRWAGLMTPESFNDFFKGSGVYIADSSNSIGKPRHNKAIYSIDKDGTSFYPQAKDDEAVAVRNFWKNLFESKDKR